MKTSHFVVVNLLSFSGLLLGVGGAVLRSPTMIILSALIDAADGRLARAWGVSSEFGASLDLLTDVAVGVLLAASIGLPWAIPAFVALGAVSNMPGAVTGSRRVTGRAALSAACVWLWWPT